MKLTSVVMAVGLLALRAAAQTPNPDRSKAQEEISLTY
jgi:hypothetical protein